MELRKAGLRRAFDLVYEHEDAIERVADALLTNITLDGDQLREIAGIGVDALESVPA